MRPRRFFVDVFERERHNVSTMNLAFSSKHPFVPNPRIDPKASRWIASLSDGSTVFEDITPGEKSAWLRLREHVKLHSLQVTNLRLEAYGRRVVLIPYKDEEYRPQINGYWYSSRVNALFCSQGVFEHYDRGIGYIKGREIIVTWVSQDGTVTQEIKPYRPDNLATIVNDEP